MTVKHTLVSLDMRVFALCSLMELHRHGFTANFTPDYLMTYCKNFIMAFPLQLIFVGPLARLIFRTLFINHKKEKNTNEIQNDDEKIVAKTM